MKTRLFFILILIILFLINSASAIIIFNDNFETGNLNGWTLSSASGAFNWTASQTDPFEGSWHANSNPRSTAEPASVLQKSIDTTGYQNITFRYNRKLIGIDAADEFKVKWFDGTSWNILEETAGNSANDASYLFREFNLSDVANNLASFAIKFECTAGATTEHCRLDNTTISGNAILDTILPTSSLISPFNNSFFNTSVHSFNATFSDDSSLDNASYYLWNSSGSLINITTLFLSGTTGSINLTVTLPYQDRFYWNYRVTDTSNNMAFNHTNFTLVYDSTNPTASYVSPTLNSSTIKNRFYVEINVSASDNNLDKITIRLFNSSHNQLQFNTSTNSLFYINYSNLADDIYFYNATANDSAGNTVNLETRNITLDTQSPIINITYPLNLSYSYIISELNYTVSDSNLQSCWYTLNGGVTNTSITCGNNISGLNSGEGSSTWRVYANDSAGNVNSSAITFDVSIPILNISCEAGGPYQDGALVLIQGNITNAMGGLSDKSVNVTLYKNADIAGSVLLTSASDGGFESDFANLTAGSYILNVSGSHQGLNASCQDDFQIGYPASFVLDKIASVHNSTNSTINYNITLVLSNKGGSSSIITNITDFDSLSSPYNLGTILANSTVKISYLKEFNRNDKVYYYLLSSAIARGVDSYSNLSISANSSEINISIPATSIGKQLVITKNIIYLSDTSLNVTYNISSIIYNSGDEDLININYVDSDISGTAFILNLTKGSSYLLSNTKTIDKAATNTEYEFALGVATVSSLNFYSNRPKVNIPGYGGPADLVVDAPASVAPNSDINIIIDITNINLDIGQDFVLDYWITSNDEFINYSSGQKTLFVGANSTSTVSAILISPSSPGVYKLKARVSWVAGSATAFDSFNVIAEGGGSGGGSSGGEGGGSSGASGGSAGVVTPPVFQLPEEKPKEIPEEEEIEEGAVARITGFFINIPEERAGILWIIIVLIGLIILFYFLKKWKKRIPGRVGHVIGLKVYSDDGTEIGKVRDVILEDNKISSLKIELLKKFKHKSKGIIVNYKNVHNIGDIIIVEKKVLEEINKNVYK